MDTLIGAVREAAMNSPAVIVAPSAAPAPAPVAPAPAMTAERLASDHPGPVAEIRTAAATAERNRILGIQAAAFPGQEALAAELIADGMTSPGDAALRFNKAEKDKGGQRLQALAAADPKVPAAPTTANPTTPAQPQAQVEQTEDGWRAEYAASSELKSEFATATDYVAFKRAESGGKVKILRRK